MSERQHRVASSFEGDLLDNGNRAPGVSAITIKRAFRPSSHARRYILLTAALLLHLALSLIFPDAGWTTSTGVIAVLAVAIGVCIAESGMADAQMRWRWRMLAAALVLWSAAYVAIAYFVAIEHAEPNLAHIDSLFYVFRCVPLLLILARSGDADEFTALHRVDSAQALVFAMLAIVLVFPSVLGSDGSSPFFVPDDTLLSYHDTQNIGLALLAIAGLLDRTSDERRHFAQALCILLTTYAVTSVPYNHLVLALPPAPPPGSWHNIIGDVPSLAFVVAASRRGMKRASTRRPSGGALLQLLLPVTFCSASVLAAFAIFPKNAVAGMAGGIAAIGLYALRSAIMQSQIRALQRFTAQVVERLPHPMCVVGLDDVVRLGNGAAGSLFGVSVEGRRASDLLDRLETPNTDGEIETRDGRTLILSEAAIGEGSRIIQFTDISHIRETEREREEALQFLAHDIRAPQAAILTLVDHDRAPDLLPRIRRHASHGLQLADDFVRLARVRTMPIVTIPIDVKDAAAEAVDMASAQARERGMHLECRYNGDEAWASGDRMLVVRAIYNLLDNGIKFAPAGSRVVYSVALEGDVVRTTVANEGSPLTSDRLTDPFVRFGSVQHIGGSESVGLGLAFVQAVALRCGGAAFYEREDGRHVFGFDLPAA